MPRSVNGLGSTHLVLFLLLSLVFLLFLLLRFACLVCLSVLVLLMHSLSSDSAGEINAVSGRPGSCAQVRCLDQVWILVQRIHCVGDSMGYKHTFLFFDR